MMEVFAELEQLYAWIDVIPLSKSPKNITRDFSDGVLTAELCKHFFPKIVDLHNYAAANSHAAKVINWETLNMKVFSKLQIKVTLDLIHQIAAGVPGAIESVLLAIKTKVEDRQRQSAGGLLQVASGDFGDNSAVDPDSVIKEIKKLKKEVQLINNTIAILNRKVDQIENLLEMKDECLRELAADVDQLKARKHESVDSFSSVVA